MDQSARVMPIDQTKAVTHDHVFDHKYRSSSQRSINATIPFSVSMSPHSGTGSLSILLILHFI